MKLINIGFGNMVSANRLVAIVSPESAPIKRIIQDAKERGTLIDATFVSYTHLDVYKRQFLYLNHQILRFLINLQIRVAGEAEGT